MEKEIQLFSSIDEFIIEQVCAILEKNNIPFIKRTDGSGSYINISMGQTVQDKRIFINRVDYDKALKLIEGFTKQEDNEELDFDMQRAINKYARIKKLMVLFILGLPILAILLIVISDIIRNWILNYRLKSIS